MGNTIDITNQTFGYLTALRKVGTKHNEVLWECRCTCGKITNVTSSSLRYGNTKSCGCKKGYMCANANTVHGFTNTRIHLEWIRMRQRCYYEKNDNYKYYGGRGITVCDEWKNNFLNFYEWSMSHGYSDYLSIDRIDNDKGYSPDNCRWVDMNTQRRNRRNCLKPIVQIKSNGEKIFWDNALSSTNGQYGTEYKGIMACLSGKRKHYKGDSWKYV